MGLVYQKNKQRSKLEMEILYQCLCPQCVVGGAVTSFAPHHLNILLLKTLSQGTYPVFTTGLTPNLLV